MSDVFCIGELLIDFISLDIGSDIMSTSKFEKKAGGAPANVCAAISKLQGSAYFLGQVGDDSFGHFLKNTLDAVKVNTTQLVQKGSTTLAFVAIDDEGERDFEFFRGSDGDYQLESVNLSLLEKDDIIHFGSATGFLAGDLKETYFTLLDYAVEKDMFISFDPNYRDLLIDNDYLESYINSCNHFISKSDFVKFSLEELALITKEENREKAVSRLHAMGAKIVAITLGAKGTLLSYNNKSEIITSIKIKQVDATGAGDAFVGGVLVKLAAKADKNKFNFNAWKEFIEYGNMVGAITCTNFGAIDAMPSFGFEKEKDVKF